jgi:outer membrane beta-barrel protein
LTPLPPLRHVLCAAAPLLCLLCALPCAAEQPVYGPDGAPTVVQRKKFAMTGRWETSLLFSAGVGSALTSHRGLVLQQRYHPNEWLDLGVDGLLNRAALSGLADQIRTRLPPRQDPATGAPNVASELTNATQLRAGALAMARVAPIYGKLNLAGELPVHFQAFLTFGAGAASLRHESVNLCAVAGSAPCQAGQFQTSDAVKPLLDFGGGMRFWIGQHASVEAQVRAHAYPDSYKERNDLTNPASGIRRNYLAVLAAVLVGVSVLY